MAGIMAGVQDRRLLVVDDEPSQLRTLTAIMEGEGFEVLGCSTGFQALEHFNGGSIGVAIVDLRLPDIGGIELLERLQDAASDVHVIVHTAHSSFESAKIAVNRGAFAYVEKTDDPDELVRHVHRAFRGRLQRYTEDLESAVAQRTRELEAALQKLELEIAERKRVEDDLRKFKTISDTASHGAAIVTPGDSFVYVNEAFARMHQWAPEELIGKDLSVFHNDEQMPRVRELNERMRRGGGYAAEEVWHARRDGSVFCTLMSGMAIKEGGQVAYLSATAIDITDRKRAEEKLRASEQLQAKAEKLAATGRMAAQVAHEINNPLAGIKNSFRLIRDAVPEDHPDRDMVGRVEREIDRIAHIVRQMFKLYSPRTETPAKIPVEETIRDVLVMLEPLRREHEVNIEVSPVPPGLTVRVFESGLQQVLFNLTANAIEASRPGGVVDISAAVADNYVRVSIRDQGPGVAAEVEGKIFEPFFTSKGGDSTMAGLGLGLSVVKGVVDSLGGRVELENRPGQGACFRAYFPV